MTTEELHKILDDPTMTLTLGEAKDLIYALKNDALREANCSHKEGDIRFYVGEGNAFYICLDILAKVKDG